MIGNFKNVFKSMIAKVFLILIIASFVLWGIGDIIKHDFNNFAVKIGDQTITREQFNNKYIEEKNRLEQSIGKHLSEEDLKRLNLKSYVLNKLIDNTLILNEARNLGIYVGDDSVIAEIKKFSLFHDEKGEFSVKLFKQFLSNKRVNEKLFSENLKRDLTLNLLLSAISSRPIRLPNAEHIINDYINTTYQVGLIKIDLNKLIVNKPDESELKKIYEKNNELFMTPEARDFTYISFDKNVLRSSINISEDEIKDAYEIRGYKERKNSYEDLKEKIKIDLMNKKLDEKLYTFAEEIDDMVASGNTIEEIAKKTGLKISKLDNIIKTDPKLKIFENKVENIFNLSVGQEIEVIFDQDHKKYHLVACTQIIKPILKPFNEVKKIVTEIYETKQKNEIINKEYLKVFSSTDINAALKDFINLTNAEVEEKEFSLDETKISPLIPNELIRGIINTEIGRITPVFDSLTDKKYFALVKGVKINNASYGKEEKVFDAIKTKIQNDTKHEIISEYIEFLRNKTKVKINKKFLDSFDS
ncbi:MAG: SurA N-terminal domain-containing protein [Sphingobacteriia bacterium]|nr:SurA N-terminal domain-containing protein [Sphingobacteriia bacterium]